MNEHLLSIHDVSADDVIRILDTAESFREVGTRVIKKVPALRGARSSTSSTRTPRGPGSRSSWRRSGCPPT